MSDERNLQTIDGLRRELKAARAELNEANGAWQRVQGQLDAMQRAWTGQGGEECFMPVPGYEGAYEVSDYGRVRSLPRLVPYHGGTPRRVKGGTLSPWVEPTGHLMVNLSKGDRGRTFRVHRLVMLAFVGVCPEGQEVRHLNGHPNDNRLANLRYGTRQENVDDMAIHGARLRGERLPASKLTNDVVRQIRGIYEQGNTTQRALAERFGVSQSVVSRVLTGKTWSHVGSKP